MPSRTLLFWGLLFVALFAAAGNCCAQTSAGDVAGSEANGASTDPDYRLGVGDTISITVFGEPDLTLQAKIGEGGRFTYAFLGELTVLGMSVRDLRASIAKSLKDGYLVDPKVSVSIVQYRPFYINGQVKNPGSFAYQPGMTVRKAISLAGGLTERGSERRVRLLRDGEKGTKQEKSVSLEDRVNPGDFLTVDESFF